MHSTNCENTFIAIATDCPVRHAEIPPEKEPKTVARIQFEMLIDSPYLHTSDDVVYLSNGKRKGITRKDFFSKGQPCLRCSPLTKRYGFGIHADSHGKIALVPFGSEKYEQMKNNTRLSHVQAMRSSKK